MKKAELIALAAEASGETQGTVRAVLAAVDALTKERVATEPVFLFGLGKLSVALRVPRMARNPRTGAPAVVSERTVVKFRPSTSLRAAANGLADTDS